MANYKIITTHQDFPVDATFEGVEMEYNEGVLILKRAGKIVLLKSPDLFIMETSQAKEIKEGTKAEVPATQTPGAATTAPPIQKAGTPIGPGGPKTSIS